MRLHTNLYEGDLYAMLSLAIRDGKITPDVGFTHFTPHGSRSHARSFDIQLGTTEKDSLPAGTKDQRGKAMHVRRYKNSGDTGATSTWAAGGCAVWAATWHEWGWFIASIFNTDPLARFGHYKNAGDFHGKTEGAFR